MKLLILSLHLLHLTMHLTIKIDNLTLLHMGKMFYVNLLR